MKRENKEIYFSLDSFTIMAFARWCLSFAFSIFCQWLLEKYDWISQIILLQSGKKPPVDRFSIADIFQKFSAVPRDFKKIAPIKVLTPLFISIFREASKNDVYFVCSFKHQPHKMVKPTQTICRLAADEFCECVWPFCGFGT